MFKNYLSKLAIHKMCSSKGDVIGGVIYEKTTRNILRVGIILSVTILLGLTLWFNLTSDTQAVQVGDEAIDFQLETLNGDSIQLSEVNSEKGVILNFWGTWCKPCREEMPDMNRIYNEGHENYEIIAINVSEDEQQINQFLSSLDEELDFPIALDRNRDVTKAYQVGPLPTTIAINKEGVVVDKKEYQLTVDDIYNFVEQSTSE
ncbi:redoxin domain-containing protein [Aliicoccus persicus]|uniref:Thiol-disulfide isomerase or thioredoxin n=1 Tax=Aliicoccus persicus TaxID=930138 RepID=A0A662Z594_9STAP|nr:redoxin domain-containing protein [Aliicoccus persicus]SEW17935.1 Thiol-disulfide isomerase or thioredoxin [Aliicoccus persicus]